MGATAVDAVMVGDSPTADVAGAVNAGIRPVLLDPFDLYAGSPAERFVDLAACVRALLAAP